MTASKRILKEITSVSEWEKDYLEIFKVRVDPSNVTFWSVTIYGPSETVYDGYQFELEITIPSGYPFEAPHVIFTSPIKHINVHHGRICLDILKKDNWSPSLSIRSVILSIVSLLSNPNYDDPYDSSEEETEDYSSQVIEYCKNNAIRRE
jgi:ubiquitin-protein ligase